MDTKRIAEVADAAVAAEAVTLLGAAMLHPDAEARRHLIRFYTDTFPKVFTSYVRPCFRTDTAAAEFATEHCSAASRFIMSATSNGMQVVDIGTYWRDHGPKVLTRSLQDAIQEEDKLCQNQPTPPEPNPLKPSTATPKAVYLN
jgi:hypothetical protein